MAYMNRAVQDISLCYMLKGVAGFFDTSLFIHTALSVVNYSKTEHISSLLNHFFKQSLLPVALL